MAGLMAEEKKGHIKITLDFEINEALMEVIKESVKNMPQMGHMWQKWQKMKEE